MKLGSLDDELKLSYITFSKQHDVQLVYMKQGEAQPGCFRCHQDVLALSSSILCTYSTKKKERRTIVPNYMYSSTCKLLSLECVPERLPGCCLVDDLRVIVHTKGSVM